jgi:Ras-related protein Rab-8A
MAVPPVRLFIFGDTGVGKTQMILRYCDNAFFPRAMVTVGVDFKCRKVPVDNIERTIQIWDTAGQERYRGLVQTHYRRAHGILLVYDVSNPNSFDSLPGWIASIEEGAQPGTPFVICGNKSDLNAVVDANRADELAQSKGAALFLTSAASGEGIEAAFNAIIIRATHVMEAQGGGAGQELTKEKKAKEKGDCCTI